MKNKYLLALALTISLLFLFAVTKTHAQCVFQVTDFTPYTEDFEGDGFDCWTVEASGTANWTLLNGASTTAAFQHTNVGDEARLISPVLDLSEVSGATFTFVVTMMALYQLDQLSICYRSSETDSWHTLETVSFSDWASAHEYSYQLPDLSPTYQISFLGHGNGGYYIFVDDILIASSTTCFSPINLEVSDITKSSALLHWSTYDNEESWVIELNDVEIPAATQPMLVEDLIPQTDYTFRVKAICGEDQQSRWSNPLSFTTLCDVITVTDEEPFFDDFESSEEFICWQNVIGSGIDAWVVDPGYLILNNTAFFIWLGGDAQLISPPLDLTAVTTPFLSFKHKQLSGNNNSDELSVWYRTSETDSWHILSQYTNAVAVWEDIMMALPNPSATYQISFLGVGNDAGGIYVDDVRVGNDPNVGVVETRVLQAFTHPNPTTGMVHLEATVAEGQILVFDLFGKQIASVPLHEGHADLDLSGVAQGVYTAQIISVTGTTTLKLVKE